VVGLLLGGFFLGAVPFSWIIGRARGFDLRREGSGNPGATNLLRVCGRLDGAVGLVLDTVKGAVPLLAARAVAGSGEVLLLSGVAAVTVLGHVYTPYLRFSGGKGVATSLGALAALAPVPSAAALGIFLVVLLTTGMVSAASIAAAAALVPAVFLFRGGGADIPVQAVCCLVAVLVVYRHRANISRILRGEEKRLLTRKGRK
jgi:glycerol-3-phosphate acyltransferase PlsY